MVKRKRLRKLADCDDDGAADSDGCACGTTTTTTTTMTTASDDSHTSDKLKQRKLIVLRIIGIFFFIAISTGLVTYSSVFDDFIKSYREQYNLVVHGTINYCSQTLNPKDLLWRVRQNLYGQDDAIDRIETMLRQHDNLTGMAIVGSTGVGKTYIVNMLRNSYLWKDNIQHHVWSTYGSDADDFRHVIKFLRKLSICGHNLILIDDLTTKQKDLVLRYHEMVEKIISENIHSVKLVIFYVFNVPRYSQVAADSYLENVNTLQNLGKLKTINFKELTRMDVENCIRQTANNLSVRLSEKDVSEILETIDVPKIGCKNVHAKITKICGFG